MPQLHFTLARRAGIEWRPVTLPKAETTPAVPTATSARELVGTLIERSDIGDPTQTPYAEAVFKLANESNALSTWADALANVDGVVADARVQVLPLVGGGDHDWTEILSRWGLLASDVRLAGLLRLVATLVTVGACVWL